MRFWPGINHLNVWEMPHFMWVMFRNTADEWLSKLPEGA